MDIAGLADNDPNLRRNVSEKYSAKISAELVRRKLVEETKEQIKDGMEEKRQNLLLRNMRKWRNELAVKFPRVKFRSFGEFGSIKQSL